MGALFYCSLGAEVLDVDVGAQTDIVGEVPALVVGIVVDDDVVAVPEPVVAEADVVGATPRENTEQRAKRPSSFFMFVFSWSSAGRLG